jgi:extracellular elastinolytic metalloproteinase
MTMSNGVVLGADQNTATVQIDEHRQFDARVDFNKGFRLRPRSANLQAVTTLTRKVPNLVVTYDDATGAVRSLSNHTGYLTTARRSRQDALSITLDFVKANAALLGLQPEDLKDYEVTDQVYSKVTGATHIYLRQTYQGLPVFNGQLHMNVNRNGRIISINNAFMPGLAQSVATARAAPAQPKVDLPGAVMSAARHMGMPLERSPRTLGSARSLQDVTSVEPGGISLAPIEGRLMWLPVRQGVVRPVWNFQIHTLDEQHVYNFTVDTDSGKVWTRFDWTSQDQYRVYRLPAESPSHTTPAPPADGRTLVNGPANANASPFGWHDTNGAAGAEFTTTQGNNVHAYTDTDANNSPDAGSSPSGGAGLSFDFPINLNQAPSNYRPAAVTNLFYWNNILHDVQHQYGFDEAAGNFQVNNYGHGGLGNDDVRAEAQDGSGTSNANFATPPDGSRPRMQMYLWSDPNPDRDGDLDNGIVIHEYGHGISNRLVGGPSNTDCLTNNQQPGEGLSDWWALSYTHKPGDTGPTPRGIGTYALGQPTSGAGIRTQRYSTDPNVNTWTYASINGMRIPHGVGSVWAQAAWEVYWALVDQWGFNPDLYNALGSAGNQRMMLYVNEGLKNTACNPTFTQVRDGIIQAATDNHGGEDVCRIWKAFAAFGLGSDAVSGGANSTNPTNGFAVPASCQSSDTTDPTTSITAPANGATVSGPTTVTASASDNVGVARVEFYIDNALQSTDTTSPYSFAWDTTAVNEGGHSIFSKAYDAADNVGTSPTVTVTVSNGTGGGVVFDTTLKAPKCGTLGSSCNSGTLLNGRDGLGPESNAPNTLNNSCADGTSGTFHGDESNDRTVVATTDGTNFAPGKTVRIDATVWAWTTPSADRLDLYYAADAANPTWVFLTTLTPTASGAQTLSATYTLPTGALQAVRARFRYQGSAAPCGSGGYDDHDDLVFTVTGGGETVVFTDDFETDKGWTVNPGGTDTATTGRWERGGPQATTSNGPKQLGNTVSGVNDLVTGRLAGTSAGVHDIDGGVTSIRSPAITLPATGNLALSFSYYLAHGSNSSSADFLRVKVVGTTSDTVFQELGAADNDDGAWATATANLNAYAGQTVRILIEAADAGGASLVEAAIDNLKVTRQ